jgi:NADPH:quinone reductase-like Zn-dependent oxidoreductase
LIADVRGYSGFTDREGNEAAARLAGRFEALPAEPRVTAPSNAQARAHIESGRTKGKVVITMV